MVFVVAQAKHLHHSLMPQLLLHNQVVGVGHGENMDHWGSSFNLVKDNANITFLMS